MGKETLLIMHGKLVRIAACLAGIGLSVFTVAWQPTTPVIGEWESALMMVKISYIIWWFVSLWVIKTIIWDENPFQPINRLPVLLFLYPATTWILIGCMLLQRRARTGYLSQKAILEAEAILEEEGQQ